MLVILQSLPKIIMNYDSRNKLNILSENQWLSLGSRSGTVLAGWMGQHKLEYGQQFRATPSLQQSLLTA